MSGDLTSIEQAVFAEDTQETKLPIYRTADGQKVLVNPGSKVPSDLTKVGARRRKTKKSKRRSKKRSLLKSRKVR